MKNLSKLFFVFILILWGSNTASAQRSLRDDEAKKATEVKRLVNSGRYTFEATREILQKGDKKSLGMGYDLDISKDTLIVYLPYLGAGPRPVTARASGITCTHFYYNMVQGKNGRWDVTIKPKEKPGELKEVKEFKLDISSRGYSTLTVTRTDRGPIAFYGYIREHIADFPRVNAQR